MLGEVVGNYRITAALSAGGMGAVYRAEHTLIGKPAAVKVLLPEWSANHDIVARFFNEAKATTAIRHPGIVEIFDFGHHASGRAYLVMELLDGESLAARLARVGRLAVPVATGLMRSMVSALAAAHARGIIHRDLKPDNVFLVRDPDVPGGERPKLLDFGIAKLADTAPSARATRTGVVLGTPTYMAPEQCRGAGSVDARADLYALGCIFYELVTGRPPFVAAGAGELMAAHLMTAPDPPSVHAPGLAPAIEQVILRLLAKSPDERPASAEALLIELGGSPNDADGRPLALMTPAVLTPVPTTLSGATRPGGTVAPAAPRPRGRTGVIVAGLAAAAALTLALGLGLARTRGETTAAATGAAVAIDAGPPAVDAAAPPVDAPPPPVDAPPLPIDAAPLPIDAAPPPSRSGHRDHRRRAPAAPPSSPVTQPPTIALPPDLQ